MSGQLGPSLAVADAIDACRAPLQWKSAVWLVVLIGSVVVLATSAAAQVCVICDQPSAIYNCRVGADPAGKPLNDRITQYACITELAKAGNHSSCRVRRDLVPGCDAPERVISVTGLLPGGATAPVQPVREEPATKAPLEAVEGPPQTVVEVARRAAVASKDGMKKAGEAVGDTARGAGTLLQTTGGAIVKGVTCVFTLFLVCSSDKPGKPPVTTAP